MITKALTRTLNRNAALAALLVAPAIWVSIPAPALAQDELSEARLRKIEAEIRALQRNVFPGGDDRFFEPQIQPDQSATAATRTGGSSTTAVTDILARLDAMETQLQQLTAITEENANTVALLTNRLAAVETRSASLLANDTSVTGPGDEESLAAADPAEQTSVADAGDENEAPRAMDSNLAAMGAAKEERVEPARPSSLPTPVPSATSVAEAEDAAEEAAPPSPERLAAVQAIAKPQTDDPADDEYSYGFRLWNAGFYPEARQQLAKFLEEYPDHWRVTYGRNLLGRAYLDDGKTEEAARWFLRNYQADRSAVRAPDSLLYLAEAMIARDDTRRACIALAEFGEAYPAIATGRLLEQYQANRVRVDCEG
jgi:TolA-binding protein